MNENWFAWKWMNKDEPMETKRSRIAEDREAVADGTRIAKPTRMPVSGYPGKATVAPTQELRTNPYLIGGLGIGLLGLFYYAFRRGGRK